MTEKWHCVELCNFVHYVSWTKQNQPYMVLHELCHLYHDLALPGGFENPDVKAAYNHAMAEGLYVNTPYRLDKNTLIDFLISHIPNPDNQPEPARRKLYDSHLSMLKHWR